MVMAKEFWDKKAEKYAKSPIADEETYNRKLETTRRYLNADSTVFEFGCGTGTTALKHAPFAKHIVATDISPKMIEIASGKAKAEGITNVEFLVSTLEDFDAPDGSFDVVMAHNILHLLEDPQSAIQSAYRLLKPDGVFVTSTFCMGGTFSHWRILLFIMRIFGQAPFVQVMKRETLTGYFKDAGFEIELEWDPKKPAAFIVLKKP
ncbi:MAG: SAM-dependent methyltransferase [Pseudohongiella sp.]|nr:MAG: SAM-dependent methyltransferase [Pseudohongiella sp.]